MYLVLFAAFLADSVADLLVIEENVYGGLARGELARADRSNVFVDALSSLRP